MNIQFFIKDIFIVLKFNFVPIKKLKTILTFLSCNPTIIDMDCKEIL